MNLDALVAPLRAEVVSGAAVVGRTAAEVMRRVAVRGPAADVDELRELLGQAAVRILDAQPAMAPLVTLASRVLTSVEDTDELADARREAARTAEAFRGEVEQAIGRAASRAARMLADGGRVVTLSSSTTVRAAVLEAARSATLEVVCLESRPAGEGQSQARALAAGGVPVVFAVDAAAESLLDGARCVLLGADSLGDRGVVNKIGSTALARAARARNVAVWVLADTTKLLPPGFPQPLGDDRPTDEVWRAPGGVQIWNRYFEIVADEFVDRFVLEQGARSSAELQALRRELHVPRELAAWAGWRRKQDAET